MKFRLSIEFTAERQRDSADELMVELDSDVDADVVPVEHYPVGFQPNWGDQKEDTK